MVLTNWWTNFSQTMRTKKIQLNRIHSSNNTKEQKFMNTFTVLFQVRREMINKDFSKNCDDGDSKAVKSFWQQNKDNIFESPSWTTFISEHFLKRNKSCIGSVISFELTFTIRLKKSFKQSKFDREKTLQQEHPAENIDEIEYHILLFV